MSAPSTGLRAGVARVTITPPVGIPLIGFAGRGVSRGVHDELTATALVLDGPSVEGRDGFVRVALVSCDLLWAADSVVDGVRSALAGRDDLRVDHVIVACSHTHYGPQLECDRDGGAIVEAYVGNLVHLLAGAVALAVADARPCRLAAGQGNAAIGINRRERTADGRIILGENPHGPYDDRVVVVRIDGIDGQPLAVVVNAACHGVSLGGECVDISADFPGVTRDLVSEQTGAGCLFLQGAAGDVNPILKGWDWTHPARLGVTLGAEVLRVYWGLQPETSFDGVRVSTTALDLPPLLPSSVESGEELVASLEAEAERLRRGADAGSRWWATQRLERARRGLAALRGELPAPQVRAELTAVGIGDAVGLVTAPAEVFTEIGRTIVASSPFTHTLFSGYSNGSIGYVPTNSAYADGGYEVTHGCGVAPGAGDLLAAESARQLAGVHPA